MLFSVVWVLFGGCLLVQIYYHLVYFYPLSTLQVSQENEQNPMVTVVICAHNEEENLRQFLPKILVQHYPNMEVIVVNDRSSDKSECVLQHFFDPKLRILTIHDVEEGQSPKKNAITKGFEAAKGEFVLLTDADCYPESEAWISGMVKSIKKETDLVLGLSPYEHRSGLLNQLVRYDTFFTALQYMGLAHKKKAYMGVGRNLMVRKSAFFDVEGFKGAQHVLAGDDDIIVSKIANKTNVEICTQKESAMISLPKAHWKDWFRQKRRHLSVGVSYKKSHFLSVGILQQTFIWQRVFLLLLLMQPICRIEIFSIYILWTIFSIYFVYKRLPEIFMNGLKLYMIPILEILYILYFLGVGMSVIIKRSDKWE